MQTLTNILYIKIPVFDPEKLLIRMLPYCLVPVLALVLHRERQLHAVGAVVLVGTHFETFLSRLPSYHEFFSSKTLIYLWAALGVVKVIHEFGHGLSCKHFGGEVHEMGFLLLCLSPAMYCNVSDAWTLPNKWHRIIISFAGIYVELMIAAAGHVHLVEHAEPAVRQQHVPWPDGRVQRQHGGLQRQPADAFRRLLRPGRLAGNPQPARPGQPLSATAGHGVHAGHRGAARAVHGH